MYSVANHLANACFLHVAQLLQSYTPSQRSAIQQFSAFTNASDRTAVKVSKTISILGALPVVATLFSLFMLQKGFIIKLTENKFLKNHSWNVEVAADS